MNNSQNHEKAIKCYDRAIEIDPNFPLAWLQQGVCYHSMGKYEEALQSYDKAMESLKNVRSSSVKWSEDSVLNMISIETSVWFRRGLALERLGKYYEAIDNYDESLKLNAGDPVTWLNKGICYHWLGIIDYLAMQTAIECYDKAMEIYPDYDKAKYFKGLALEVWPHLRERQNWE